MGAMRRAKLEVRGVSLGLYNERTRKSLPVLRDLDFEDFLRLVVQRPRDRMRIAILLSAFLLCAPAAAQSPGDAYSAG